MALKVHCTVDDVITTLLKTGREKNLRFGLILTTLLFIMYTCALLCVCHVDLGGQKRQRYLILLELGFQAVVNHLTHGCWEQNLHLLEEQQALFNCLSSFQPHKNNHCKN